MTAGRIFCRITELWKFKLTHYQQGKNGETRKPGGTSSRRRFRELLLQAADELDQALDLVVSQFAFELWHLALAFLGHFEQVGV